MTKKEFLEELEQRISVLKQEEIKNTIEFYEEYFEDAGAENEQKVIEELGDMKKLAEEVIAFHKKSHTGENLPIVKNMDTTLVNDLHIEIQNSCVELLPSYSDKIEYKVENIAYDDLTIYTENNQLVIEEKMGLFSSKKNFINFFKKFNMNSSFSECLKRKISIYVPPIIQLEKVYFYSQVGSLHLKNIKTKELEARTNCGNLNLKTADCTTLSLNSRMGLISLVDVQAERVKADSGAGSIKVLNMNPQTIRLSSGAGAIFIENIQTTDCFVSTAAGSIKVFNCETNNLEANSGAGIVEVKNTKSKKGKFNTGTGSIILQDCDSANSKINTGMGSVKLKGTFHERTIINTSMGSVDLNLAETLDNYYIKLSGSLGRCTVNDRDIKEFYNINDNRAEIGNADSKNIIGVSNSMGKINIRSSQ